MKKILSILLIFLLCTCTVEKRRYMTGYYMHRSVQNREVAVAKQREKLQAPLLQKKMPDGIPAFAPEKTGAPKETVCDTVYQANGVRMIVKVTKVYRGKTYYLLCDSDNEAEFDIETAKLKKIVYANGKTDSLKKTEEDPVDYYHPKGSGQSYQAPYQRNAGLEKAKDSASVSLVLVIAGIFFFPLMIAGLIIANNAKRKLRGQRGYEKAYKTAAVASGIGTGCLLVMCFFILLFFVVLLPFVI